MKIEFIPEILASLSILLIIYPFVIYPIILKLLALLFNNKIEKDNSIEGELTVVIAAYNEEDTIENCIKSIYNSNYPNNKIKVLVGSDGSDDRTHEIIDRLMKVYNSLNYFIYERSGKNFVINKLVKNVDSEYIYFLDADCRVAPDTFNQLFANFASEKVGAAFSPLNIIASDDNSGGAGEKGYQSFETFLRYNESLIHSPVNSFGSCLLKKEHFEEIPNSTVCDDFYHILSIISKHKRVIFDKDTFIYEVREKSLGDEFARRKRLVSGGLATIFNMKRLLLPSYGIIPFFLFSHKISKWLTPLYLLVLLISSLMMENNLYREILLMGQYIMYISALVAWFLEKTSFRMFLFKVPLFFVSMNLSFLLGWLRFFSGKQNAIWNRDGLED